MIERPIPKEIKDFKEKIVFGLTVRQLISTIITLGICVPTYIFGRPYLGDDIASWVCILVGVPSIAFGFFQKNGMVFEKYICAILKSSVLLPTQRKYRSENFFEELEKKEMMEMKKSKTSGKPKTKGDERSTILAKKTKKKEEQNSAPENSQKKEEKVKKSKKNELEQDKIDKKKLKQMEATMKRRRRAKSKLPKTTQHTIPYVADYDNGLIEIEPNVYSKCIDFSDVNYQVARIDDQINIFCKWGECLNYFSPEVDMSYTINNKPINAMDLLNEIKIKPLEGHEEDTEEFNTMIQRQFMIGRNDIQKEKYMTITIHAESPYEAMQKFSKIENEVIMNLARTGSVAKVQSTERRLSILHDFFRPNNVGELQLDWDNIKSQGISSKDFIAPSGMFFKRDCFKIDDVWYRCVFINNLPSTLVDKILHDLTDYSFPMMCTVSVKALEMDKAIRLVKRQITGMEAMKIDAQKKAVRAGYDPELSISHELRLSLEEAEKLLENIQSQNQKMFYSTICLIFSGSTLQELEENQLLLNGVARQYLCQMQILKYQQEDAMKQILPLGHDVLSLKRTLTTESLGVFIPFTSQELNDKNGVYFSLNSITKNLIRVNRKKLNNPNGFILGESGSGKSFAVKKEVLATYLSLPEKNIFIIDPEKEYVRLVEKLGGQVIKVGVGSDTHINICDMDKNYSTEGDPVAEKVDFLLSVCECMARGLTASQQSIIDHVTELIYRDYLQDFDDEKLPTFETFYKKIMEQDEPQAKELGLSLRTYATGSLSIFAKKTNVNLNNRLICFDISSLGTNLQNVGLLVVSELIWNKLVANRNKISTSVYIDEFHLMFKNPTSENFAEQLFARIRKYGGDVTGITQNVDTLLQSEKARGMLGNSLFTVMLSQSDTNRKILADMFSIGDEQLSYITNADKGTGLIRAGGVIVPFGDEFPKDINLYRYMTSNPDEIREFDRIEEEKRKQDEKKKAIERKRQSLDEL